MSHDNSRHSIEANFKVLIGDSPRMVQLQSLIQKVGSNDWPVLILGETGTGKELVARSIHRVDPQGPFVTIDCSSLVGALMESELFGYAKGAFTGAFNAKAGLIEAANGGTAFFDEIGELSLDLQSKLLRVLQEKEFRPVGALATKRSDFRIIAATNRDLAKEVEKGTFRRDLYYRLNVMKVRLAPLRDRREDIPKLIHHFMRIHKGAHMLTPDVFEAMMKYDWPGNVRELENCVQRMIAMSTGPHLTVDDLPSSLVNEVFHRPNHVSMRENIVSFPSREISAEFPLPLTDDLAIETLVEMERKAIIRALEITGGDRHAAASKLGIGRTTLYRKLKEYALEEISSAASA